TLRLRRTEARHELEHSTEVLRELSDHFVPALERSAGAAQRLLEAGEGDAQGWLLAQRALTQGRVRRVRAVADRTWAAFQLAELGEVGR
ncbi:MAG: hypothetical protein K1X89_21460, partial [Myxococcaceae bacterium]|nr:hypothetical protein [Myxococcaceae bacterium]